MCSSDLIYVHDTVDAIVKLHEQMVAGDSVNISTNNQIVIGELLPRICKDMGYTGEVINRPARKADVLCHIASNVKIRGMIEYMLTPFEQGLSETLNWYKANIKVPT